MKKVPSELPYWGADLDGFEPLDLYELDTLVLAQGARASRVATAPDDQLTVGDAHRRKMARMDTREADELEAEMERLRQKDGRRKG